MGSQMKNIAALLLATTALSAATMGVADVYQPSQEEPFFWADDQEPAPAQPQAAPTEPAPMPAPAPDMRTTAPQTPVAQSYPREAAPQHYAPEAGTGRYFNDDDCLTNPNAPWSATTPRPAPTGGIKDGHVDPTLQRRGEMTGDDGVLEAIQDTPCTKIHRRGGENAASANNYTHPDDIRRVNTLEDRRIPVHNVGRYTSEDSSLWHRDPTNPFVDSAREWRVERGIMLSHLLTTWGEQAGYNVVWRSPHDYIVQTDVVIHGSFPEAAGQVLESFYNANPPISGDFYPSNRVLVVDSASDFDGR